MVVVLLLLVDVHASTDLVVTKSKKIPHIIIIMNNSEPVLTGEPEKAEDRLKIDNWSITVR